MSFAGLAGLAAVLAGCASDPIVLPGGGAHPADPAAYAPPFRPAPDPLLAAAPPAAHPASAHPMREWPRGLSGAPAEPAGPGHSGHAPAPPAPDARHTGHGAMDSARGADPGDGGGHAAHGAPSDAALAAEDRLVLGYLAATRAVARDDVPGAGEAFEEVRRAAEELVREARGELGAAAANALSAVPARPTDVEQARTGLRRLSEAVIVVVRVSPPTAAAAPRLWNVHCPMARASWLQTGPEVANPYFGGEMRDCGEVTETIEARAPAGR